MLLYNSMSFGWVFFTCLVCLLRGSSVWCVCFGFYLRDCQGLLCFSSMIARPWVHGQVITVSLQFSICRVSECHSNYLNPVKRLQLTLTGFSQLRIIQFGFLTHRLSEAIKRIVSCSQSARCLGKKKKRTTCLHSECVCVFVHVGK